MSEETPLGHKLFEKVHAPTEAAAAAATTKTNISAGGSASAASVSATKASEGGGRGTVGRVLGTVGNALFFGCVGAGAFFGYHHYAYDRMDLEQEVKRIKESPDAMPHSNAWASLIGWYLEQRTKLESEVKKYAEPPSDRLLPDLPPHARHVKTLVLDLDDVLVHSDWTRGRGWRTFKRPGAEEFIKDLSQYYELVVYTSQLPTYADPILDRLDPQRLLQYRLYRDSTRYIDGKHVRDLSKLNRNLAQVLLVTADPEAYSLQPENAIKLKKWKVNDTNDTTLLDLLPFLEAVVRTQVPDVRAVVQSYEGEDVPTAFRQRMEKVQEAKAKRQQSNRSFLGGLSR